MLTKLGTGINTCVVSQVPYMVFVETISTEEVTFDKLESTITQLQKNNQYAIRVVPQSQTQKDAQYKGLRLSSSSHQHQSPTYQALVQIIKELSKEQVS